ncbi:MAG: protein TolQ [Pelagibacteraceae bacterium]|nr:protein TolQ [Pelagibacteraceae bacterium]|tara:strand:+ start:15821 stop:16540 length:720 start_codon:yes stop_codon:yes gene_type:complete
MENIDITNQTSLDSSDFSMFALFMQADFVVKSVILILILASLYSWNVIVSKILRLKQLKKLESEFDDIFWSGNSFEDLYETLNFNTNDPKSKIFCAAISEWKKSKSLSPKESAFSLESLKDRMQRSMTVIFNKESEIIEKNLTFLATAGSTAPFIGLFGTVWGIMNSFKSIAIAQNTNLSVVAPGIAEALFATALGLFVAIPAVVAYNKVSSDLSKYFLSLETFMDEFTTIFFRQLEKK